ncbi:MAG TPA: hypothetical protein VIY56_13935, partial [Vicinamibacterales bacterium]
MARGFRGACVAALLTGAAGASSVQVAAQTAPVTTPPANIILPNYLGVSAGPYGGLESSASVARVGDPSAAWFNPAGLSRAIGAEITGSAGLYQFTTVSPQQALDFDGGSTQQLPNLVGFTVKAGSSLTAGLALVTTNSWIQNTDAQLVVQSSPDRRRFSYSADSELSRRVAAMSVGYTRGGAWRLGAGLAMSFTSLRLVESISDRKADTSVLRTVLVSSRASGSTLQVRPQFGAQFDGGQRFRAGLLVRAPGFTVYRQGSMVFDSTIDNGDQAAGASIFDTGARFDQRLPAEVHGGVAYVGDRVVVEFDAQGYTGIDPYPMVSSTEPILTYSDGPAGAPVVSSIPFPGLTSASRGFANLTVGGHYVLSPSRTMRLHFGVATDRSPVADADQIFGRADMQTWTLGLSGSMGRLTFAAGANVRSGTADNITIRNLLDGQTVQTAV